MYPTRVIALAVLCVAGVPALAEPTGDVNDDGSVSAADAILVLEVACGEKDATPEHLSRGDLNGDGNLTELDAALILRKAVGSEPSDDPLPTRAQTTVLGDTITTFRLSMGHRLSGSLSFPNGGPTQNVGILFPADSGPPRYAQVNLDGSYSIALAPGTHSPRLITPVEGGDPFTGLFAYDVLTSTDPASVPVTSDASQDFARPALPDPGTLRGSVSLPGTGSSLIAVVTEEDPFGNAGYGSTAGSSYSLKAPPDQYRVRVSTGLPGQFAGSVQMEFPNLVSIVENGTTEFNIETAPLVAQSGTVQAPAGVDVLRVTYFGTNRAQTSYRSSVLTDAGNAYTVGTFPGPNSVDVEVQPTAPGAASTRLTYHTVDTVLSGGTGTSQIVVPNLPDLHQMELYVNTPAGTPVSNVFVELQSKAQVDGFDARAAQVTDAQGRVRVRLPDGDYNVTLTPY